MKKVFKSILGLTVVLGMLFFGIFPFWGGAIIGARRALAVECVCSGSITANLAGCAVASAAGCDLQAQCLSHGGSFSDNLLNSTCSFSNKLISYLGDTCPTTVDKVLTAYGVPSGVTALGSASGSCQLAPAGVRGAPGTVAAPATGTAPGGPAGPAVSPKTRTGAPRAPATLPAGISLTNPLAGGAPVIVSPFVLFGGIIRSLIGLMGVVALFLFVVAGIMWLTAAGNEEKITKAKQIMVWAVIGIAVILGSYVILSTVFEILPKAPPSTEQQRQEQSTTPTQPAETTPSGQLPAAEAPPAGPAQQPATEPPTPQPASGQAPAPASSIPLPAGTPAQGSVCCQIPSQTNTAGVVTRLPSCSMVQVDQCLPPGVSQPLRSCQDRLCI